MYYQKQTILHDPENGVCGDCFRTALACLLDMQADRVPHFFQDLSKPTEEIWRDVNRWLYLTSGLRLVTLPFHGETMKELMTYLEERSRGLRFTLTGSSPRGADHTIIVQGGRMILDPHPEGGGLVGPCADGFFYVDFLLPTVIHGVP